MKSWAPLFMRLLQTRLKRESFVLGIDENTARIGKLGDLWQVFGEQTVSIITRNGIDVYWDGDSLYLPSRAV
ncbi:MAG: hypothetical protein JXA13_04315 [Anaerolineales bacterium]|nr:hypothetical protein [Anaerolineales bacterium]